MELTKPKIKLPKINLPEIKKPNIELPEIKKPDITLPKAKTKAKSETDVSDETMMKLWTMCSVIGLGCSGIAFIVALF